MLIVCKQVGLNACRSSTQVALKAREVLIACQMPSYDERKTQMESILKSSVTNSYYGEQGMDIRQVAMDTPTVEFFLNLTFYHRAPAAEVLRELVDSRYTVYDVLPTFFNDTDQEVIHGE